MGVSKYWRVRGKPICKYNFLTPHHPQNVPTCSSNGRDCYEGYDKVDFSDCLADCEGLYADIDHFNESVSETSNDKGFLDTMIETYELYKRSQMGSFTIVQDERMLDEVWFPTERHSPTCVSHSHCTGFDKLCKHCVTKHHFRDTLTCTLTPREGGSPIFLPVKVISHCNVVHVYD